MKYWLGRFYLWLTGWKVTDPPPPLDKYVIVVAPHTSNWDVPAMLAVAAVCGINLNWVGKHTLFRWPLGWFMRWIGGVPIDRRARHNAVDQLAAEFDRQKQLKLVVPPEGTRSRAEYWKTGFYYIALKAGVPIVLAYGDYARREAGFGPTIHPSGDIEADMQIIKDFYEGMTGKYPEHFAPPRLKPETAAETADGEVAARGRDEVADRARELE